MRFFGLVFTTTIAPFAMLAMSPLMAQDGTAQSSSEASEPYRIYPGDEIEIYVWGEERLQRSVKILPDGTLAFPLVGQVLAAGRTLTEIEAIVTERLQPEYRGEVPRVTVSVVSSGGTQFSVMGRVNAPGAFTPARRVNVLEALAMAGGPSEFANLDDIVVLRKQGGAIRPYRVSISRLFKSNLRNADVNAANIMTIQPGDTIIVP
ncbi:polysaccharide biosynthesis/export family protein [Qipengyuania sphaerica]|uniref:polysaccharide biosynthesis/export family protein n=1 Tax=Qipengyuania sphaerica TaxID=2867243 RepID=UPI001FFD1BE7|nr:polysaccharide biosynthesis/export family protein [Qipengyuania sphaerica]